MSSPLATDSFDEDKFVVLLCAFGIPFIVVFVIWSIIMSIKFHWRPQRWARFVIANSLKKDLKSKAVSFVVALWWIFFALPFLIAIAFGIVTALIMKPFILGVIIAVAPVALILLLLAFLGFANKGYRVNTQTKIQIVLALFIMFALYIIVIVLMDPISWMATGYLFLWPPLAVYAIAIIWSRVTLTDQAIERVLHAEESKEAFIQDMFDDKFTGWMTGSGSIGAVWAIIIIVSSIIFNGVFFAIWFNKPEKNATLGTAAASLVLDILIIVSQYTSIEQSKTLTLLFLVYIMKSVIVTFSSRFWFIGHGFLFFVLGTYFITRFLDWLLIGFIKDGNQLAISEEPIDPKVEQAIRDFAPQRRCPTWKEAISSFVAGILLIVGIACEIVFLDTGSLEVLPFGITQTNGVIACVVFTIAFGCLISPIISIYENKLKVTIAMFIVIIIGAIIAGVFFYLFKGLDAIIDFKILIFLTVFFIFDTVIVAELIVGNHYKLWTTKFMGSFSDAVLFILLILDIAAAVVLIVLPFFAGTEGKADYSGLLILLFVSSIFLYIAFSAKFLDEEHFGKRAGGLLAGCFVVWIGFNVALYLVTEMYIMAVAIFGIGIMLGLYIFSVAWCRAKGWLFTLGPMLVMVITSAVLLVLGVVGLFMTDLGFLCAIFAVVASFVLFGALTFFFLQKDDYDFHWPSILCLCLDIICGILVIVGLFFQMSAFISISACFVIVFIIGLLGVLGYLSAQDETDVIVFSNLFFPIRRYRNGHATNIPVFSVCFILVFVMPWIWGLLASAFFDWPQFGSLGAGFGFAVAVFLICILLYSFDFSALSAIEYMDRTTIEFAVNKAIKGSGATIGDDDMMPPEKDDTYEDFVIWDAALQAQGEERSLFMSALKAQMYISANVAFRQAVEKINKYFNSNKIAADFMEQKTFTPEERWNMFKLLEAINGTAGKTSDAKNRKEYEDYVKKQEEERAKKLADAAKNGAATAKKFADTISKIHKSKEKFVDKEFHPAKKIEENPKLLTGCTWERADDLYKGSMTGKTDANELCQGAIGDCYLISAMASLASRPAMVAALFEDANSFKTGAVCVTFHVMGKKVPVIIDTQLPVKTQKSGKKVARFVKPRDPESSTWWFTMVEKAYAKQHGSYTAITGGHSHVAFYRLIGGWPEIYNMDDLDVRERINNGDLWRNLLAWSEEGFLAAGSHAGSDTNKNEKQIVQGHAYSILQVKEVKGFKLLQLRNPWGDSEWTGDWGDKSPLWQKNPDVAKALGHSDVDDGMFWINFKDFTLNYSLLFVDLRMDKGWFKQEVSGVLKPGPVDGSKPVTASPPASNLQQFILRFTKSPSKPVKMTFERTGASIETWVYGVINDGKAIGKLRKGMVYKSEAIAKNTCIESWEWEINGQNALSPWTLVACRNVLASETNFLITVYCDVQFELTYISDGPKVEEI